jgi:hypothetical protein
VHFGVFVYVAKFTVPSSSFIDSVPMFSTLCVPGSRSDLSFGYTVKCPYKNFIFYNFTIVQTHTLARNIETFPMLLMKHEESSLV